MGSYQTGILQVDWSWALTVVPIFNLIYISKMFTDLWYILPHAYTISRVTQTRSSGLSDWNGNLIQWVTKLIDMYFTQLSQLYSWGMQDYNYSSKNTLKIDFPLNNFSSFSSPTLQKLMVGEEKKENIILGH